MRKLILALMLSVLLLGFGTVMAADSSIDNVPGGAAIAYVQAAAGGWQTLVNAQNTINYRRVHVTLWDGDSNHILDWSVCLTPYDNYGVVISASDATGGVRINDYSDGYTASNSIPDVVAAGTAATFATHTTSGIAYGYLTLVNTGFSITSCVLAMADTSYSDATPTRATDNIFVREAWVAPSEAMAMNAATLQGFVNMGTNGFTETGNTTTACWMNLDADATDTFTSIDDGIGSANIDWYELFITNNDEDVLTTTVTNDCDPVNALGAAYAGPLDTVPTSPRYWARFNDGGGYDTVLVTVAPDLSHAPSGAGFDRYDHFAGQSNTLYDDAEAPSSVTTTCPDEVCYTDFGSAFNQFHNGGIMAGEVMLNIPYPIFGFIYTESAAWADIYPLITDQKARWNSGSTSVVYIP